MREEAGLTGIIRDVRWLRLAIGGLVAGLLLTTSLAIEALGQGPGVLVVDVDGPITPVIADHLARAVETAVEEDAVLVVTIDTPGGLDTSMRDIVQTFLNSPTPIVALADELGLLVIAEGAETEMEHKQLLELGVKFGQGYLYGKPEPLEWSTRVLSTG